MRLMSVRQLGPGRAVRTEIEPVRFAIRFSAAFRFGVSLSDSGFIKR